MEHLHRRRVRQPLRWVFLLRLRTARSHQHHDNEHSSKHANAHTNRHGGELQEVLPGRVWRLVLGDCNHILDQHVTIHHVEPGGWEQL
jgi:hypothetical protein